MKKLHIDGSLGSLVFEKFETCEPCLLVYMHEETPCKWTVWTHLILNHLRHANHTTWARWLKVLVFSKMEQESNLLEVIHFDVCSPMSAEACSGYHYVLTSQMIWVDAENIYLMKHKSELLKGSSNFRVKLKIFVTRGLNFYDIIIEMNIWVASLVHSWDIVEIVSQLTPRGTP